MMRQGIRNLVFICCLGFMVAILAVGPAAITMADDETESPEVKEQQFLFMMEEAYTQKKGEWQIGLATKYMDGQKSRETEYEDGEKTEKLTLRDEWQGVVEMQYGLLDWLEVTAGIPVMTIDKQTISEDEDSRTMTDLKKTGIGDIEAGAGIRLLKEDPDTWWRPAAKLDLGVKFPTGKWKEDRGTDRYAFEAGFALSKIIDKFVVHANAGAGYTDFAREQGEDERVDKVETECGLALVYRPTDRMDYILEAFAEFEEENIADGYNYETQVYLIPGIRYQLFKDFEIGAGVPIGLTYESHDWGIIAKMQYEW